MPDVGAGVSRPSPHPVGSANTGYGTSTAAHSTGSDSASGLRYGPSRSDKSRRGRSGLAAITRPGRQLARADPPQPAQVVAAAGGAIVTAARVGRLLGRSGWRIARQLPGVNGVEQRTLRLRQAAAHELGRLLDVSQQFTTPAGTASAGTASASTVAASAEEQRVMMLVRDAGTDPAPLRTAMTELLDRSAESDVDQSRDYLFGTIVSQLVPDEARILAALATDRRFAAVDVVAKQVGRSDGRVALAHASTVGAAAGIALPQNESTYLTRLQGLGLIEFGKQTGGLEKQFESLQDDPVVVAARKRVEKGKHSSAKISRKSVQLSALGREFWAACAPPDPRRE